jgi:hypothetical protein
MKRSARSNWQMLNAVLHFLEENGTKISEIPRIPVVQTELKEALDAIETMDVDRQHNIKRVTKRKTELMEAMNQSTVEMCNALQSHAHAIRDVSLIEASTISKSALLTGGGVSNFNRCTSLFILAEEAQAELVAYGWDEERMNKFRLILEETGLMMTAPRRAIAKRSADIKQTYVLIDTSMDTLKNQLDKLMHSSFANSDEHLFNQYMFHRKSIEYGARTREEESVAVETEELTPGTNQFLPPPSSPFDEDNIPFED